MSTRFCPLARVTIPCAESAPLCGWCGPEQMLVAITVNIESVDRQRTCPDCGIRFDVSGTRQVRCKGCGAERARKKNCEYQQRHRARHRTNEEAERSERRTWQMEAARSQFESLSADGMSASAIAERMGHSHHTVLRHLARPEVQQRVALLRRWNMPEPELIH